MPSTPSPRQGTLVRAILWIVLSTVFVVWTARRVLSFRAAGHTPPWFLSAQLAVWVVALGFWLWTGWRELKQRDTPPDSRRKVL